MAKTTILIKKNLNPGLHESNPYHLPVALSGNFQVHLLMDRIDLEDPAKSVSLDTYISEDSIHWRYFAGIKYIGGVYDPPGIPGFGIFNAETIANKYIKASINVSDRMSIGIEVESF